MATPATFRPHFPDMMDFNYGYNDSDHYDIPNSAEDENDRRQSRSSESHYDRNVRFQTEEESALHRSQSMSGIRFRNNGFVEYNGDDDGDDDEDDKSNLLPEIPKYDAFTSIPEEKKQTDTDTCYEISTQIFKLVVYVLTFAIVLFTALLSKGTVLFMTSQIRPGKTTPYCDSFHSNLQSFEAVPDLQEQAQWIWVLFLTFITPEFFTLLRSVRLITFKSFKIPTPGEFFLVWLFETLHTAGVAILVFLVLPELDVIKGLMLTNCLCIVPGIFLLLSRNKGGQKMTTGFVLCLILDALAIFAQATGLFLWPLTDYQSMNNATWAIPLGIILTSLGWWENYIEANSSFRLIQYLEEKKRTINLQRTRYFVYVFVSIWKMLAFFLCMIGCVYLTATQSGNDGLFIFKYFITDNSTRTINIQPTNATSHIYVNPHLDGSTSDVTSIGSTPESYDTTVDGIAAISVWAIQMFAAYVCYITCKFACRVQMQGFSFAIPISLTVPTAISILIVMCGMKSHDVCFAKNVIPRYLFWECPPQEFFTDFIINGYAWIWFFWFISQIWITFHIWVPRSKRLASTEKIFLNPMYDSILIDQSVTLNRRRDDGDDIIIGENYELLENMDDDPEDDSHNVIRIDPIDPDKELQLPETADQVTTIKACITMWHETPAEQLGTLISLMKLDQDQCIRRLTQKYFEVVDKDYYKLEAHIFVDDAFKYNKGLKEFELNDYVKSMLNVMNEAAKQAYRFVDEPVLKPPRKYATPYGGRLVYTLLGGNKLFVHLKDKMRIRHRKRWSQVMYMYYLLGIRLNNLDLEPKRKDVKAENTYLLALDGDIQFEPNAVLLLVDLMKKNVNLGAACGRIHPVGSGLMAWYQQFEYAIGHWLQKATEHVIGCVLCSPGCFSLFRGQALMENNVMNTYTTRATEARHYVQYDQGEDRWLCTLLLQQGYRVEYAAASDAYTHCPESFAEFYSQRRRWVPSTVANIMDLLTSAKRTVQSNDDISIVYIAYQMVMMGSSIIGPGTIFLMVLGAMVSAFGISNWTSMWINIIPLALFILTCFLCKQKTQIKVAALLTCIYALIMMAVLVGIFLEIADEGWLAPSSFFLIFTASLFVLTALLHPKEVFCLLAGVIYWVVIPSMYMLLIIFSAMNMNDVTWGVREDPTESATPAQELVEAVAKKENIGTKTLKTLGLSGANGDDDEYCSINCGNLWNLNCCTHPKPKDEVLEQIAKLSEKIDTVMNKNQLAERRRSRLMSVMASRPSIIQQPTMDQNGMNTTSVTFSEAIEEVLQKELSEYIDDNEMNLEEAEQQVEVTPQRDPDVNPYWIEADFLSGPQHELNSVETEAWKYIIKKYLLPLTEDDLPEGKAVIERKLKSLRNQTVFSFFMLNTMFVVTLFLLQLHQDTIYIEYPNIGHTNITWIQEEGEVKIEKDMLHLEPIGLALILVFAVIMIIQFVAMLFHRFGTVSLILATTDIKFCENNKSKDDATNYFQTNSKIVNKVLKARGLSDDEQVHEEPQVRKPDGRRNTLHNIDLRNKKRKPDATDMEGIFRRRMTGFALPNENVAGADNWRFFRSVPEESVAQIRKMSRKFSTIPEHITGINSYGDSASTSSQGENNYSAETADISHV